MDVIFQTKLHSHDRKVRNVVVHDEEHRPFFIWLTVPLKMPQKFWKDIRVHVTRFGIGLQSQRTRGSLVHQFIFYPFPTENDDWRDKGACCTHWTNHCRCTTCSPIRVCSPFSSLSMTRFLVAYSLPLTHLSRPCWRSGLAQSGVDPSVSSTNQKIRSKTVLWKRKLERHWWVLVFVLKEKGFFSGNLEPNECLASWCPYQMGASDGSFQPFHKTSTSGFSL